MGRAVYQFALIQDVYPSVPTSYTITLKHDFPGYIGSDVVCNDQPISTIQVAKNQSLHCSVTTRSVRPYKTNLVPGIASLTIHWSVKKIPCSPSSTDTTCVASSTINIAYNGVVKNNDRIDLGSWSIKNQNPVVTGSNNAFINFGRLTVTQKN